MSDAVVDVLDVDGVAELLARAAAEGWEPGIADAAAFHATDPAGFLARRIDGAFAAGISVVRLGAGHGFLGLYIADPDYRGQGHGIALWHRALDRLSGRVVGLDGVLEQQGNYRRSGFGFHHRNVRYEGARIGGAPPPGISLRIVEPEDLARIVSFDAAIGGLERRAFIAPWCLAADPAERLTLLAEREGELVGLGTIRQCVDAHKIGPLLADDVSIAEALLGALCARAPVGRLLVDVPEPNRAAVALVERSGFRPVFETARMYRGNAPAIALDRLFAIATFELG